MNQKTLSNLSVYQPLLTTEAEVVARGSRLHQTTFDNARAWITGYNREGLPVIQFTRDGRPCLYHHSSGLTLTW